MLGYALAKLDFRGKQVAVPASCSHPDGPGVVTFVPLFVLVSNLGLVNTYAGLILPFLVGAVRGLPDAAVHPGAAATT